MTSSESGSAFRRCVTALAFDLRFDAEQLADTSGHIIAKALQECSAMIESAVESAGGRMVTGGAERIFAVFGAEDYYADHAGRAISLAVACLTEADQNCTHRAGLKLAAAIHTAEMLVIVGETVALLGPAPAFLLRICRVGRPSELLITQPALESFVAHPPQEFQAVEGLAGTEPNYEGVSWNKADFYTLPEDLQKHVWLFGPQVEENIENSVFEFSYMFSILPEDSDVPIPILGLSQVGAGDLEFANAVTAEPTGYLYRIGKYRITQKLGTGGMGEVWLGVDDLGMSAAVKVMNQASSSNSRMKERFAREARVMAKLQHRNICRVFELGEFDGVQYLAMEYISGVTLGELLQVGVPGSQAESVADLVRAIRSAYTNQEPTEKLPEARLLPVEQAVQLMIDIADGIQFAHEHGVLHRDLKPANVLIRADGDPVVSDFGLAKFEFEGEESLSISGELFGTLEYMSPEQALSTKEVDVRADVYGLGGIMYQLLTGHRHFKSTANIVSDAQRLQTHEPLPLRSWRKELSQDLEVIVLKALSLQPEERYRTVAAFREDLVRFLNGEVILARPPTFGDLAAKAYAKNRLPALILASALAIIIGVSIISFWQVNAQRVHAVRALAKEEKARAEAEAAKAEAAGVRKVFEETEQRAKTAVAERDAAKAELAAFREDIVRFQKGDLMFSRPGSYLDFATALYLRHKSLILACVIGFPVLLLLLFLKLRQVARKVGPRREPEPASSPPKSSHRAFQAPPRAALNLGISADAEKRRK